MLSRFVSNAHPISGNVIRLGGDHELYQIRDRTLFSYLRENSKHNKWLSRFVYSVDAIWIGRKKWVVFQKRVNYMKLKAEI